VRYNAGQGIAQDCGTPTWRAIASKALRFMALDSHRRSILPTGLIMS
jgi:hypothetical protein